MSSLGLGVLAALPFLLGDWQDRVTWFGGPGEEGGAVLGVGVCFFWEKRAEEA